ncbi:hypothetical protein HYH03_006103 [Edaphochlamys debaryana]|uniref:Tubulin--tyrosine ligase-like protein 5 n=1 Tax=Edaphochlamys debaryana TaxID=47281 RepID=A0A836C0L5_9CHLO|nr:hypothetical protein HYH03_006103 [Edaphochlamys debaryana]|eukprot:KAG2495865.1 hypothetical protein HYH03_006103 [Edaphochlamys debaryana]
MIVVASESPSSRSEAGTGRVDEALPLANLSPAPRRARLNSRQRCSKHASRSLPPGRTLGTSGNGGGPLEPPSALVVDRRAHLLRGGPAVPQPALPFRFWIDEVLWSQGRVAVQLAEQVFTEAGGLRTGGPTRQQERERKQAERLGGSEPSHGGPLGSQHTGAWEVLWTKSTYAIPAARAMRPGQLVSALIGLNSLTMKKRMLLTLRAAYGTGGLTKPPRDTPGAEPRPGGPSGPGAGPGGKSGSDLGAYDITPLSFALPEELDEWAEHVRQEAKSRRRQRKGGAGAEPLWILKTGQDAGKGLSLLPADRAVAFAREQLRKTAGAGGVGPDGGDPASRRASQLQVAQAYVADPFLLLGRKFHLRLWVLVTSALPLRAYLHRRGLVLFSSDPYDPAAASASSASSSSTAAPPATSTAAASGLPSSEQLAPHALPSSHITNYARNSNTLVWSLQQLEDHLGPNRFGPLWASLRSSCARAIAASQASLAEATAWLRPAVREYGFQMMGVDFLLDERLKPWLLEFNSSPSIMVQHEDEAVRQLIYEQKYGMMRDVWGAVQWRVYPPADAGGAGGAAGAGDGGSGRRRGPVSAAEAARMEAQGAGEFERLLP